eukprot:EG_transcript_914
MTKTEAVQWASTKETAMWFSAMGKGVNLEKLAWDTTCFFGQGYAIDDNHFERLVANFKLRPPRRPIEVTIWENEGDKKMYILAKHFSESCTTNQERAFPAWIAIGEVTEGRHCGCAKLQHALSIRRKVSGADNAIVGLQRVTTISECMTIFLNDKDVDFRSRLARAVKGAGLVTDMNNPWNNI